MYRDDDDEREGLWLLVMVKLQDDDGSRKQLASMYELWFFFPVTTFSFSSLYEPMIDAAWPPGLFGRAHV